MNLSREKNIPRKNKCGSVKKKQRQNLFVSAQDSEKKIIAALDWNPVELMCPGPKDKMLTYVHASNLFSVFSCYCYNYKNILSES